MNDINLLTMHFKEPVFDSSFRKPSNTELFVLFSQMICGETLKTFAVALDVRQFSSVLWMISVYDQCIFKNECSIAGFRKFTIFLTQPDQMLACFVKWFEGVSSWRDAVFRQLIIPLYTLWQARYNSSWTIILNLMNNKKIALKCKQTLF